MRWQKSALQHNLIHIFLLCSLLPLFNDSKGSDREYFYETVRTEAHVIPDGFIVETLTQGGLDLTAIAYAPNGRVFLAERSGLIWSWQEGIDELVLELNIQDQVYENDRRGIESMVVHASGRLFVLYAVSDVEDGVDGGAFGRVVRYDLKNGSYSIDENTQTVLLGEDFSDGIPACNGARSLGRMGIGQDGSLLIATSDAAEQNQLDRGGFQNACFGEGRLKNEEDIGAYRAQSLESLAGKVLRIDAQTGEGLATNPFFNGDKSSIASKVWAYGLREPAGLITLKGASDGPSPGILMVPDRGWKVMEELNITQAGGSNYGWPCMDGLSVTDEYVSGVLGGTYCNDEQSDLPVFWWHHQNAAYSNPTGLAGARLGNMTLNDGFKYPPYYEGRFFYSDQSRGWLATAVLDDVGQLQDQQLFSIQLGAIHDMQFNPYDEYVYFINLEEGALARLRHDQEADVVLLDGNNRTVEVAGAGFYAEYFDDANFTGDSRVRIDSSLSYDTFEGPEGDIYNAARWEGYIIPEYSEVYTIHVSYLENVRFWMNEELLIDDRRSEGEDYVERLFVSLKAGVPYRIKIEQSLENDEVKIGLAWSSASQPFRVATADQVVYTIREGVNLCLLETAQVTLSSTLSPFAEAGNACDGNTDGDFFSGSVAVTESQPLPYWEVDLGALMDISGITLWERTDCCQGAIVGAFIFVSESAFQQEGLGVLSQPGVSAYQVNQLIEGQFSVPVHRTARYVRVQHPSSSTLYLAEAQIHAGVGNLEGAPPASGLISWWPFENEGRDRRGGNTGSLLNGARTVYDNARGRVLDLDGVDDVMEVPHSDRLNGIRALTYALWIKSEAGDEEAILMSKGGEQFGQMSLQIENDRLIGRAGTGNGIKEVQASLPSLGKWHHVALVYSGNGYKLYVNGIAQEEQTFEFSPLLPNSLPVTIGGQLSGRVDDVVLYDVALTETQLQELIGTISNVATEQEVVSKEHFTSLERKASYPNPFMDQVYIDYALLGDSYVHAEIYDSIGRRVRSFPLTFKYRGNHSIIWDGRDDSGRYVRAGGYFIRIMSKEDVMTTHLIKL